MSTPQTPSVNLIPDPSQNTPLRPEPIAFDPSYKMFVVGVHFRKLLKQMKAAEVFVAKGSYASVLGFYSWLKKQAAIQIPITDFESSRANKALLQSFSDRLLVPISKGKCTLQGAPQNGWISELYPKEPAFLMRFSDFLGLNGSWQWFKRGISYPGLSYALHPYYGVYFPTRTEHLELFDSWLSKQPQLHHALDMGTGCGVLAHYLLKHGCEKVTATDINVNALISLKTDAETQGLLSRVSVVMTSFFEGLEMQSMDLVVFNPPWIPAETDNWLDAATHYHSAFFETFFTQAAQVLKPGTRLVVLFSTFALEAGLTRQHPIEEALKHFPFGLVTKLEQPIQQPPSARKSWLSEIRKTEKNQLWVLNRLAD